MPAARRAASASWARARSPTSIRSTSPRRCSRRSRSATTSTPPRSTTSSGARHRRSASRAATSAAWRRSTPATTSRPSGVTLDRFCGSGITAVNLAAAAIMAGHRGPRHRRRHRDDVDCRSSAPRTARRDGRRQPAPARAASAVAPGRLRRRHRHAGGHPARALDDLAPSQPAARRHGDRARAASTAASCRCSTTTARSPSTTRSSRARRRRARGSPRSQPRFAAVADVPLDEDGTTFRELINQMYPDLEIEHVHHAGNSSGVVDGAAALLLASADYAKAARPEAARPRRRHRQHRRRARP